MGTDLRAGLLAAWLTASPPAGGDLTVIGRDAGARPAPELAAGLLDRFTAEAEDARPAAAGSAPQGRQFAVIESELAPAAGQDGTFRISTVLPNPVCVIGSDRISRSWLQRNRGRLAELGARCVLVEVASQRELEIIRNLARPVPVLAVPFDDVARAIGLRHVPALLTGAGQ